MGDRAWYKEFIFILLNHGFRKIRNLNILEHHGVGIQEIQTVHHGVGIQGIQTF